jgi:epoxyqueuosine reductase QueG
MTIAQEILNYAYTLFDVVGAVQLPDNSRLIIVGLESTPERDLDEFHSIDGKFHLSGFEKHARPRLESLLTFICKQGFSAQLVGQCGYPLKGEVKLKEAAVQAGLGRWGKNTIVLHPKYGNRLRFMAIKTDAPLEPPADYPEMREENPICSGCTICIDVCPEKVLEPYRMPETKRCLANISRSTNKEGRLIPCDICLRLCPASN